MSLLDGDLIIVRTIGANLSSKEDAYCIVESNLDSTTSSSGAPKRKSFTVSKSSNPEWGNEFVIPISGMMLKNQTSCTLTFTVMDDNKLTKDVMIGSVALIVDCTQFPMNEEVKRILPLNTQKKNEVEVAIRIVRVNGAGQQIAVHKCTTHNISINTICKTCSKLMCSACAVSKLHNTHKIHLIEEVEGIEREEIFQFKNEVEKWQSEEKISISQLENELGDTEISITQAKQQISSQFISLRELLAKEETEKLNLLESISQSRMNYLKELVDWKLSCDQLFQDFEKMKPYDFLDLKLSKFGKLQSSLVETKKVYQPKKQFVKNLEQTIVRNQEQVEKIEKFIQENI